VTKARRKKWACHVACIREVRIHTKYIGKIYRKRKLIKMDLKEIMCEGVEH
jgi:hypothetical protein